MKKTLKYIIPTLLIFPVLVFAAPAVDNSSYISLIKIPVQSDTFGGYINALYLLAVSLAAILAVLKLILAGVKYMLSDVVTNKSDAKNEIKGALVGLLIIIAAVVVLNEINPNIADNNVGFPEKVKNVKFEIRNPGITKTAGGETVEKVTSDLTTGLPSCAKSSGATRGGSSGTMVVTVDVSDCPAADRQNILASFENTCEKKPGGSAASGGSGSNIVACAVPLAKTNEWDVNEYSALDCGAGAVLGVIGAISSCTKVQLDNAYVKKEGNVITYDAEKFCKDKHPTMPPDDCKEEVEDAFIHNDDALDSISNSFCDNNAGRRAGPFACELPAATMTYDELTKISKLPSPDIDGYRKACEEAYRKSGYTGVLVDTKRTGAISVYDYKCVAYDSDN